MIKIIQNTMMQKNKLKGTLEEKLDQAYKIYQLCAALSKISNIKLLSNARDQAMQLMKIMLNTDDTVEIIERMEKRQEIKKFSALAVPGTAPEALKLDDIEAKTKGEYLLKKLAALAIAYENNKIIAMTEHGHKVDNRKSLKGLCYQIMLVDTPPLAIDHADDICMLVDNKTGAIKVFWIEKGTNSSIKSHTFSGNDAEQVKQKYNDAIKEMEKAGGHYAVKLNNLMNNKDGLTYTGISNVPMEPASMIINSLIETVMEKSGFLADHQTIYQTPKENTEHQVKIKDGKFYKFDEQSETFKICDTGKMRSKEKATYAGYTINKDGTIAIFNHMGMMDRIAHSSMNAGAPVFSAGEIVIENGLLKKITTSSGHYAPSREVIYQALTFFKKQGVDVTHVVIEDFVRKSGSNRVMLIDKNIDMAKINYQREDTILLQLVDKKNDVPEFLKVSYYNKMHQRFETNIKQPEAIKKILTLVEMGMELAQSSGIYEIAEHDELIDVIRKYVGNDCDNGYDIAQQFIGNSGKVIIDAQDIIEWGDNLSADRERLKKEMSGKLMNKNLEHAFSEETKNATLILVDKLKNDADELIVELNECQKQYSAANFNNLIVTILKDWGVESVTTMKDMDYASIIKELQEFSQYIDKNIGAIINHKIFAQMLVKVDTQKERIDALRSRLSVVKNNESEKPATQKDVDNQIQECKQKRQ